MWTNIDIASEFYISYNQKSAYEINITDFVTLWTKHFTKESFLNCLQKSNDQLEIQDEQLISNGIKLLSNPDKLKAFSTVRKDDGKELQVTMTRLFGYPFKLKFELERGNKEEFFNKITQPLLRTINDLHSSQSKLLKLLKKKDNEIEEYKCEGGEIALRYLRTVMFNEREHATNHTQFEDTFGGSGVSTALLEKVITIPEKKPIIQQIPEMSAKTELNITMVPEIEIKNELESQNSVSLVDAEATNIIDIKQEITTEDQPKILTPKKKKKKLNF